MKKQQLLFLLIAYALSVTQIFAQENAEKQSRFDNAPEPQRRRWAVTFGANQILKSIQGESPPYGLTVTKYSIGNDKKTALAYNFNINASRTDYSPIQTNYNNTFDLSIGVRYEHQHQWGRFMLFYGPGISVSFHKYSTEYGNNPKGSVRYTNLNNDFSTNAGFYFGSRFFLNSRLSINIISDISVNYGISSRNSVTINGSTGNIDSDVTTKEYPFITNLGRIGLGLGIHF